MLNYFINTLLFVYYLVLNYFYIETEYINDKVLITLYKNNIKFRFINKTIHECREILNNDFNKLLYLKSQVNIIYLSTDYGLQFDITKLAKQFCYYYDKEYFDPEIIVLLTYKKYKLSNVFKNIVIIFNDENFTLKKEFVKNKNNYFIL